MRRSCDSQALDRIAQSSYAWRVSALVRSLAVILLLSVGATPVRADPPAMAKTGEIAAPVWAVQQSELCAAALRQAEQRYHLPASLLMSIAKAESGRPITALTDIRPWPWTIDADGTGLFLDSKAAAIAWMRLQTARHSFIDVGCMQIDLHYQPNAFASLDEAFDPAANADYAARLLVDLYRGEAGGNWDLAVGLYHSHPPLLAAEYRDRVALIGASVLHGTLKTVPLYVRAIRQGTLRLPLGGGKVALINVHRQPAARSRHPFSNCQIEQILAPYLNAARPGAACVQAAR
jgi:hypothetical protein